VTTTRTFSKEYTTYGGGWGAWPSYAGYGWGGGYYGYAGMYGWGYGPWYTEETIVGALTIDLVDAATGQLLWRGVGEKDVHHHSKPESRAAHTTHEVQNILKKLPSTSLVARRTDDR